MPWLFLAVAALAFALIKLGAMSVWVVVLAIALKVALAIAVLGALYVAVMFLWRR